MKTKKLLLTGLAAICFASLSMAQVPAYVPSNGLVAWYPFNGNANDESGNGHNGVANNGAILTTDRFNNGNKAYSLDGVNDYISSTLGSLTKMTFSFWYNSVYPVNFYPMFLYIDGIQFCVMAGNNPAYIQNNNVGHLGGYSNSNSSNYVSSLPCIPTINSWHHVVIVYDNSINKYAIYIDGSSCGNNGTAINPMSITSGNATFGNTTSGTIADGNAGVKGKLDDIGIWNRALTQQEISNLYLGANVGVSEHKNNTFISLYPNPSNNELTLTTNTNLVGSVYKIVDYTGKLILTGTINSETVKINTSELPAGIYMLQAGQNNLLSQCSLNNKLFNRQRN